MYTGLLVVHSALRWVVLFSGIAALGGAVGGATTSRAWLPVDNVRSLVFVASLDLQVLLGVVLYAVSPVTRAALEDVGVAMGDSVLRFYLVEHLFGMIIALALVHVGRVRLRRATTDAARHRTAMIFFGLALVALMAAIPWPGMAGGRVLFRGF